MAANYGKQDIYALLHPNDNTASIWVDFKSLRRVIEDHGNPVKTMKFE